MNTTTALCEHCGEALAGSAYRVTSEEQGVRLLDMVVCNACYLEALKLGLDAKELDLRHAAIN
jgi:hypothetical protein